MEYFVRDSAGDDFAVGTWRDGSYVPGSRSDAVRELRLLAEPGSYVWGRRGEAISRSLADGSGLPGGHHV